VSDVRQVIVSPGLRETYWNMDIIRACMAMNWAISQGNYTGNGRGSTKSGVSIVKTLWGKTRICVGYVMCYVLMSLDKADVGKKNIRYVNRDGHTAPSEGLISRRVCWTSGTNMTSIFCCT
jgi:hypothetical protein